MTVTFLHLNFRTKVGIMYSIESDDLFFFFESLWFGSKKFERWSFCFSCTRPPFCKITTDNHKVTAERQKGIRSLSKQPLYCAALNVNYAIIARTKIFVEKSFNQAKTLMEKNCN